MARTKSPKSHRASGVPANEELQNRTLELSRLNNDPGNLFSSVNLPIVMLSSDLRIRRLTPMAEKVLNLIPADVGRSMEDAKLNLNVPDLETAIVDVIETGGTKDYEVQDHEGRWHLLRITPSHNPGNKIDGAVLVLVDIDAYRRNLEQLRESRNFAQTIVETVREPLVVLDGELRVQTANRSFYQMFRTSPEETENHFIYEIGNGQWNIPALRKLLEEIIPLNTQFENFEVTHDFPAIGRRTMLLNARRVRQPQSDGGLTLLAIDDISERKRLAQTLEQSRNFYLRLLEEFPAMIWRSGLDAKCNYFNQSWLRFTGRTLEQEQNEGWVEGVHPEDREQCVDTYLRAFHSRQAFEMEYRLRRHDGEYRWIMDFGRPFDDLEGNFAGYLGSCYDITERKQSEEELHISRTQLRQHYTHMQAAIEQ